MQVSLRPRTAALEGPEEGSAVTTTSILPLAGEVPRGGYAQPSAGPATKPVLASPEVGPLQQPRAEERFRILAHKSHLTQELARVSAELERPEVSHFDPGGISQAKAKEARTALKGTQRALELRLAVFEFVLGERPAEAIHAVNGHFLKEEDLKALPSEAIQLDRGPRDGDRFFMRLPTFEPNGAPGRGLLILEQCTRYAELLTYAEPDKNAARGHHKTRLTGIDLGGDSRASVPLWLATPPGPQAQRGADDLLMAARHLDNKLSIDGYHQDGWIRWQKPGLRAKVETTQWWSESRA